MIPVILLRWNDFKKMSRILLLLTLVIFGNKEDTAMYVYIEISIFVNKSVIIFKIDDYIFIIIFCFNKQRDTSYTRWHRNNYVSVARYIAMYRYVLRKNADRTIHEIFKKE